MEGAMKKSRLSRRELVQGAFAAAVGSSLEVSANRQPTPALRLVSQIPVPKQSGRGVYLKRDQRVKVVSPKGPQVGDLFAFKHDDPGEFLSPKITMSQLRRIYPEVGKPLFTNKFKPLLMLEEDTVGVHDLLYQACDQYLYRAAWGEERHPNCRDNLNAALRLLDFTPGGQPDPHNLFQNSPVIDLDGHVQVQESRAKPGDYVLLRALEDAVVVVTACSVDRGVLNGGSPKELLLEVYEGR
jgi:uncharacterized protein YcgI (DUF1989 family)